MKHGCASRRGKGWRTVKSDRFLAELNPRGREECLHGCCMLHTAILHVASGLSMCRLLLSAREEPEVIVGCGTPMSAILTSTRSVAIEFAAVVGSFRRVHKKLAIGEASEGRHALLAR